MNKMLFLTGDGRTSGASRCHELFQRTVAFRSSCIPRFWKTRKTTSSARTVWLRKSYRLLSFTDILQGKKDKVFDFMGATSKWARLTGTPVRVMIPAALSIVAIARSIIHTISTKFYIPAVLSIDVIAAMAAGAVGRSSGLTLVIAVRRSSYCPYTLSSKGILYHCWVYMSVELEVCVLKER